MKTSVIDEARRLVAGCLARRPARGRRCRCAAFHSRKAATSSRSSPAGYDGTDRWYLEALGIGASGNEEALYSALLPALGQRDPHAVGRAVLGHRLASASERGDRRLRGTGGIASTLRRGAEAGAGRAGLHQRSARRAGDGRPDAQRASRRRGAGSLVDDVPEDERLARISGGRMGRRSAGRRSRPRSTRC